MVSRTTLLVLRAKNFFAGQRAGPLNVFFGGLGPWPGPARKFYGKTAGLGPARYISGTEITLTLLSTGRRH